ncbi:hypothetical protein ACFVS2_22050 [Brevibacillus sp. NPDC058079]|uniref:hypothetical protein n=1 Tax=Brevibacillus sp. NPDC058079 TaxID=3346330 RepID=UPI0036E88350
MKKQVPEKGYVFLSVQNVGEDNHSLNGVIIKTNLDFKIIDVMETVVFTKETVEWISKTIENPLDYRFVSATYEDFAMFSKQLEKYVNELPRDFVRIVKSRFWNIQSEVVYRLKCPADFRLEQLSELYGLTTNSHPMIHVRECLQLVEIARAYWFDKMTNNRIIEGGYEKLLRAKYATQSTDKLMDVAFRKGYKLTFVKGLFWGDQVIHLTANKEGSSFDFVGENVQSVLTELRLKLFHEIN